MSSAWALIRSVARRFALFGIDESRARESRGRSARSTKTPDRICYIHIGTHKTGTTSIQAFAAANRERFASQGVMFPTAGTVDDPGVIAHHELANELRGSATFDASRGGLQAVASELEQTNADVACLTSEDLSFLYDKPQAMVRLRNAIEDAGFSVRIVAYLRPQASYCVAVYAENVRHGYREPFDHFLHDVLSRGCYHWHGGSGPPFDYAVLLDAFSAVFGRDAIVARAYQSSAPDDRLLASFAALLLGRRPDLRLFSFPTIRYNGSLDFAQILRLLGVENGVSERLRFTPLDTRRLLNVGRRFFIPNVRLAWRYAVVILALEPIDIALALPFRKTLSKTLALASSRRALTTRERSAAALPQRRRR